MIKLFLLKPGFTDDKIAPGQFYYCPHCAMMEGIIRYYPKLVNELEIQYVDFKRPRQSIIVLIGPENQNCPVLILEGGEPTVDTTYFKSYQSNLFINSTDLIARFLAAKFNIGLPHP